MPSESTVWPLTAHKLFSLPQLNDNQMLCMTPWVQDYAGESKTSCGGGLGLINFGQQSFKEAFSQTQLLQEAEKRVHPKTEKKAPASTAPEPKAALSAAAAKTIFWHTIFIALNMMVLIVMVLAFIAYKKGWITHTPEQLKQAAAQQASS